MTGVVNYKQLNVPDPVAVAIDAMGMTWLSGDRQDRRDRRASARSSWSCS